MPKLSRHSPELMNLVQSKLASMGLTFGSKPAQFNILYQRVNKRYGLFQHHPITGLETWPFGPEMFPLDKFKPFIENLTLDDMMGEELSSKTYAEHYAKQVRVRRIRAGEASRKRADFFTETAAKWDAHVIDEGFMVKEQRELARQEALQLKEVRRAKEGTRKRHGNIPSPKAICRQLSRLSPAQREQYFQSEAYFKTLADYRERGQEWPSEFAPAIEPYDPSWDDIPLTVDTERAKQALLDQAMSESMAGFSRQRSGEWAHIDKVHPIDDNAVAPEREPDATGAAPLIQRGLFD